MKDLGKIDQYFTTTKHNKALTVCIFPGMYCAREFPSYWGRSLNGNNNQLATNKRLRWEGWLETNPNQPELATV